MKLILDTTSKNMSIILAENGEVRASKMVTDAKHQQHLLPELENLLLSKDLTIKDLDEYAVVVGPGSFTGIRLGIATIKALCIVFDNKKAYPINMLELLLSKTPSAKHSAVLIKCTSSKVYLGYIDGGKVKTLTLENDKALDFVDEKTLTPYAFDFDTLCDRKIQDITLSPQDFVDFCEGKKGISGKALEPIYMALSQAEEELKKKEKND